MTTSLGNKVATLRSNVTFARTGDSISEIKTTSNDSDQPMNYFNNPKYNIESNLTNIKRKCRSIHHMRP